MSIPTLIRSPKDIVIIDSPCGCPQCNYDHTEGHYYCLVPSKEMLVKEELGLARRIWMGNQWRWIKNTNK